MSRSKSKNSPWELTARHASYAPAVLLAGVILCVIAWFWQFRISAGQDGSVPAPAASSVRLNELMSSNKSALMDDRGEYSDWIELLNASSQPVDITGWKLSDGSSLFTFPAHVLGPGETVLVHASGSLHAVPGRPYHAPFRLSASGETVTLTDAAERTQDLVELPAMEPNFSYARTASGEWEDTSLFTPGLGNEEVYTPAGEQSLATGLVLSEIMPKNASYAPDADGDYSDYIELYNGTGRAVSLSGFTLSDDEGKRDKWTFPDISIEAGQYLIVYASGKDRTDGELHTNFGLSSEGETILLSDAQGRLIGKAGYDLAEADVALSLNAREEWTALLAPTPGYSNDEAGAARVEADFRRRNTEQVFINEIMSSTRIIDEETAASYDWVELYNASSRVVDLSGWGLSDSASRPRKWQFPEGASIGPGSYMIVWLSGQDEVVNGEYHTSFSLSLSEGEGMVLCRPDGTLVDRAPMARQYAEIAYGRVSGQSGFFLFDEATPGSANTSKFYYGRAQQVVFSEEGGLKNGSFTLTLSAGEGETIYYTTDCTDPTTSSIRYTGPIPVSSTTVVRAIAVRSGYMDSLSRTHTYLLGVSHTLPVVSLVSDPEGMFSEDTGMYVNIDKYWTRDAHIEYFTLDGQTLFSQGAEISLHGNDARNYQQKTMNVIARSELGDNRFRAAIFPNRDYTEYQSFLLRPSSEDGNYTRMRCSVLSMLAEDTTVLYQDTVVAILYINGEYWGHYNLRERVNAHAVAQWEGWTDVDAIDLVKGNDHVKQGSNRSFRNLLAWLDDNDINSQEDLDYVNSIVDVENYLDYVMLEMYVANSDLMNVKRYRSDEGDGRWRWILFDLDWAFHNDTDSYSDWLHRSGCGLQRVTDNTLFRELMKYDEVKEYFLRLLGERMATCWSSEVILGWIDERQEMLIPEMEQNYTRWGNSLDRWYDKVDEMREYAKTRPAKLIDYIADYEDLTKAEIEEYFGEALRANPIP